MERKIKGPSYDDQEVEESEVFFSTGSLATLAQASYGDVQIWASLGYIKNSGRLGRVRQFRKKQIQKTQLMALLVRRMGMKPHDASRVAEELMKLYENHPEGFKATVVLAQTIERGLLANLVSLILDLDLTPKLIEMLRGSEGSSG